MAAEKKAAEAAIQAFEKSTSEQIEVRKPSRVKKFFNVCNMRPVRGQKAPVSPSVRDVVARLEGNAEPGGAGPAGARRSGDAAAPGAEVYSREADVNSSAVPRSEADQEVALPGPSGGGETPEEAGGVGDETGLSQEEELRGGDQGRDQGGDGSEAAPAPRPPAAAAAAVGACKRRGAARRYPPAAAAAASSLARLGGAGHPNASGMAEVATQTTPEQSPENASSHSTTVALRGPLPLSSDSDNSEPGFPVVSCSRDTQSQSKIQGQEKVTESPSSSLAERVGRTKATDCGRQQQAAAVSTGQLPGRTAERQAERGRPALSLRRPRGGADFGRETEGSLLPSNSARREMGIPGRGRGVSSPVLTVTQQGRRETAPPPHLPAAPSNGGGGAAQPGCHGNNNAESSSATDGEMATLQQKFQQNFFNSSQETKDIMKKYSSTECFPRCQEGWTLCKSKLFQIQCG